MCMSANRAEFSVTRIYVGEATRDNKRVHVLAYQNTAKNLADKPNAMILPIPSSAEMNEKNVIDTTDFKGFMKDIADATKISDRSFSKGSDRRLRSLGSIHVFNSGSYTVVLSKDTQQIAEALDRCVAINKRPSISESFLEGFGKLYPDHQIAVCCWDGKVEAEPLLWWYEPQDTTLYFVPTMDAHDGNPPNPEAYVHCDHVISVGHASGKQVHYTTDNIPETARNLLPTNVHGVRLPGRMRNGDMHIVVADIKEQYNALHDGPTIIRRNAKQPDVCALPMRGWRE
jgi:hypothetical protein